MRGENRKTATKAKLSFVRPGVGVLHAERREFENAQIPGVFFRCGGGGVGGSKRYLFIFCQRGYASLFSQELALGVLSVSVPRSPYPASRFVYAN